MYRLAAQQQRDSILASLKSVTEEFDRAIAAHNDCVRGLPPKAASEKCETMRRERESINNRSAAIKDEAVALQNAVMNRYDGVPPSWW